MALKHSYKWFLLNGVLFSSKLSLVQGILALLELLILNLFKRICWIKLVWEIE